MYLLNHLYRVETHFPDVSSKDFISWSKQLYQDTTTFLERIGFKVFRGNEYENRRWVYQYWHNDAYGSVDIILTVGPSPQYTDSVYCTCFIYHNHKLVGETNIPVLKNIARENWGNGIS